MKDDSYREVRESLVTWKIDNEGLSLGIFFVAVCAGVNGT